MLLAAGLLPGATASAQAPPWPVIPLQAVEPDGDARDLEPLRPLIGAARVIGFAEGGHARHEFLALRNRVFRYCVENLGVTAIAVETGFTESTAIDDYVLGLGPLTPAIVRDVFTWHGQPLAENRQLLEWMRAYNARPSTRRPVRFYGIDLSLPGKDRGRNTVEAALAYVGAADPAERRKLDRSLAPLLEHFSINGYGSLDEGRRDALTAALADMVSLFERNRVAWLERTDARAYHRAWMNAAMARHLDANLRASGWGFPRGRNGDLNQRDAAMADAMRWILDREATEGRVFLFAATSHLNKLDGIFKPRGQRWTPLGAHLRHLLGRDFLSIGAFDGGSTGGFPYGKLRPDGLEESLRILSEQHRLPLFLVDLRGREDSPPQSFDAALFIEKTMPAEAIRDEP